ncbi:hypothetical protein Zmor_012063, partial [Zophobas morio]
FSHLPFLGTPRVYEVIREKYFKVKVISFPLSDMRKSSTSLDFNNFEKAYKHKTIAELVNALLVLRVCRVRKIVSNARYLVTLSYKILGETITNWILRKTFYKHFCGGIDEAEVKLTMNRLKKVNIGTVLDYAAEAEVEERHTVPGGGDVSQDKVSARIYRYEDEKNCDVNAEIALRAVTSSAQHGTGDIILYDLKFFKIICLLESDGFAALKITALTKPELLEHMSLVIKETKALFSSLVSSKETEESKEKTLTLAEFSKSLKQLKFQISQEQINTIFKKINTSKTGAIKYDEWISYLEPTTLSMGVLSNFRNTPSLDEVSIGRVKNMFNRLEMIISCAQRNKVKLLIDAEQSYIQPAIDHLTLSLQRKYNKETPLIYTTIQGYLKNSHENCKTSLNLAKREGWVFACKLVRGAYLVHERARCQQFCYDCPVFSSVEETHKNYNDIALLLLSEYPRCKFMIASHNEDSALLICREMDKRNISKAEGGICFGQLLGMSDHITYNLSQAGYKAYKYVPYGPVKEVLPYLIRRAEENSGLLDSTTKEMSFIRKELYRRFRFW